ncbi:hypothetical protein FRC0470_02441 [Corynebacterium diphtheriae]|nr:hypothetical protein FRC0432_01234 [Corynebacterium diphtheriae]CAB0977253.1 hypothetical protein FRC0470_02441 [Corynebacterium diphtheriae]
MTTISIDVSDAGIKTRRGDKIIYYAPRFRKNGSQVVSTAPQTVDVSKGLATIDVHPGPLIVEFRCRNFRDSKPFRVVVPDSGQVTLADLLERSYRYEPEILSEIWQFINAAKRDADRSVERASVYEQGAKAAHASIEAALVEAKAAQSAAEAARGDAVEAKSGAEMARDEAKRAAGEAAGDVATEMAERIREKVKESAQKATSEADRAVNAAAEAQAAVGAAREKVEAAAKSVEASSSAAKAAEASVSSAWQQVKDRLTQWEERAQQLDKWQPQYEWLKENAGKSFAVVQEKITQATQQVVSQVRGDAEAAKRSAENASQQSLKAQAAAKSAESSVQRVVNEAIAKLKGNAPEMLDTLEELAERVKAGGTLEAEILQKLSKMADSDTVKQLKSRLDSLDIASVKGLSGALAGKANSTHTHNMSDVIGLENLANSHARMETRVSSIHGEVSQKADKNGIADIITEVIGINKIEVVDQKPYQPQQGTLYLIRE